MQNLRAKLAASLQQVARTSSKNRSFVLPCNEGVAASVSLSLSETNKALWWRMHEQGKVPSSFLSSFHSLAHGSSHCSSGRGVATAAEALIDENSESTSQSSEERPKYIKTKKLTKTAAHIMQILDKEAVAETKAQRPIPDLRPGDVVQLKIEVPENKRRVSTFRGLVIAMRRSGMGSTFRIRRFLAGVGVEMVFPLYSPNIKELKVLEHRNVRRNKLYYLRDKIADKINRIN